MLVKNVYKQKKTCVKEASGFMHMAKLRLCFVRSHNKAFTVPLYATNFMWRHAEVFLTNQH